MDMTKTKVCLITVILLGLILPEGVRAGQSDSIPPLSPYALPYSMTSNSYDWHRLWINTATLSGAFAGTLLVLECLPEDAA